MIYLHQLLESAALHFPLNTALIEPEGKAITYQELAERATRISDLLINHGINAGDRIGIYSRKSIDMVASIFGILKSGAAYVPVDPESPVSRNGYILTDCQVKFILADRRYLDLLSSYFREVGIRPLDETAGLILLEGPGKLDKSENTGIEFLPGDLAYILYTSGSTGNPKGVCYPHKGAMAFVDWCSEVFQPRPQDVFSSHAPFHFDLSIFDLYVCCKHAGTLVLIGEELGKSPMLLAELISKQKISIWYSTPSILTLLTQFGKLERYDYPDLRHVLFAGEVFPIKHLKALKEIWKHPRFFNLYGPTETNVCTYYEIPRVIAAEQTRPFPIGKSCTHLKSKAFDEDGREVNAPDEGELFVTGPIMAGYWNLPERNAAVFVADSSGNKWYKTGDIVRQDENGNFVYVGRKDRMVKKRGYRVELGEIEVAMLKHPAVTEAAVIAAEDQDGGVLIKAFVNVSQEEEASVIRMKKFSIENLPAYMVPDRFVFLSSLPKTSTDKTDYQKLKSL